MSKMFDYISGKAEGEYARLEASLDHALGCLGREIELHAESRKEIERLQKRIDELVVNPYRNRTND